MLILAAAALVILASSDYLRRLERLQGEYFALILLSATGMMLLPAAVELIAIYLSLELTTLPLAALAASTTPAVIGSGVRRPSPS